MVFSRKIETHRSETHPTEISSRWLQKVLSQPVSVRGWCGSKKSWHFMISNATETNRDVEGAQNRVFKEFTKSLQSVSWTCACSHLRPLIVFHWDLDAKHGWMNWRCISFSAWWPFWIFLVSYNPTTRLMRNSRSRKTPLSCKNYVSLVYTYSSSRDTCIIAFVCV